MTYWRQRGMKEPRRVTSFPERGNHIGDKIVLPSGKVYIWNDFKRWERLYVF